MSRERGKDANYARVVAQPQAVVQLWRRQVTPYPTYTAARSQVADAPLQRVQQPWHQVHREAVHSGGASRTDIAHVTLFEPSSDDGRGTECDARGVSAAYGGGAHVRDCACAEAGQDEGAQGMFSC